MKNLLFLTAILLALSSKAQDTYSYSYTYDASGNRQSRVITFIDFSQPYYKNFTEEDINSQQFRDQYTLIEEFEGNSISMFPNPTNGILVVDISSERKYKACEIHIYSLKGSELLHEFLNEGSNQIHLFDFQAGTYIVKLTQGESIREYKLVKL